MKTSRPPIIALLLVCSTSLHAGSPAGRNPQPTSPDPVPEGLAKSDWSRIRAAYEAGRHAAIPQDNGTLTARNPGQQWRTDFDGKGFTVTPDHGQWTWGLELTGYGERTLLSGSSPIAREGGKITCQRDANLTEWFMNDTRGLEQGWTIQQRPALTDSSAPLRLHLSTRGNLRPQVSPDGFSVSFHQESDGCALTFGGLKAWDADGKNLPVHFEQATENHLRIAIDEHSARYPITIDPVAQQAYLKASNANGGDHFGGAVAVYGNTVVVGAYREKSNATGVNSPPPGQSDNSLNQAGAAYVFVRDGGGNWSQQAYLKASNTAGFQWFGSSVAISGDTVVIGANGVANAAYVFVRSGVTWSEQAILKAFIPTAGYFGVSVAISGNTVVVGDMLEDSAATGVGGNQSDTNATDSGAAFVFVRSGTAWSQQAYLKASNTGANDYFGLSVSVSVDTVVVGAMQEASSATGVGGDQGNNDAALSGAAYVFVRSGTTWSQQAYLKASNTEAGDKFGGAVSVSGDSIVIGAIGEDSMATGVNGVQVDNNRPETGAAYVFARSGTVWSQQAYLKASFSSGGEAFGGAVSISGDILLVGAVAERSAATGVDGNDPGTASNSGAAYLFARSGSYWGHWAYLKASNAEAYDNFATSVSVSGSTTIIGATGEDSNAIMVNGDQGNNSASLSGAAYGFELGTPPVIPAPNPFVITDSSFDGTYFTIHFTGQAGVTNWRVTGSPDLTSFPDDWTAASTIYETSPGIYEVAVNLGEPPARYFLRIER